MNNEDRFLFSVWLLICALAVIWSVCDAHGDTIVEQQIVQAARHAGVSPSLALAIADVESGGNPNAVGSLGELGVFQLRPEFHSVTKGDTRGNIELGVRYLAALKRQCASYGDAYFVCFNYGTARRLVYPRLFPYYQKVKLALQRRNNIAIARADK